MASDKSYGNSGLFVLKYKGETFNIIVSDGSHWEHVSVSLQHRCPKWEEMSHIKDLFFGLDDTVMQLHVPSKVLLR